MPLSETKGESIWGDDLYEGGNEWRRDRVWLSLRPQDAADWVGDWVAGGRTVVYEVVATDPFFHEPDDPDDEEGLDFGPVQQVHASGAAIVRLVPPPY